MQKVENARTQSSKEGYSLVEVVISMFILTMFVLAFTRGLTHAKYVAEDNLYTSTALTVAVSTIEQMKGASLNVLANPPQKDGHSIFTMIIEDGNEHELMLDEVNNLSVPIVTEKDGSIAKRLDLKITPSIQPMSSTSGYWLTIEYSYEHPRSGKIRTETVRNARSTVPSH